MITSTRLAVLAAASVSLCAGSAGAQALTVIPVPSNPSDPTVPHPAYNGHQTTLKAVSRGVCETPYFRWTVDGSPVGCLGRTYAIGNGGWYSDKRYGLDCQLFLPEVDRAIASQRAFTATIEVACSVAADGTPSTPRFGTYPLMVHAWVPRGRAPLASMSTHAYNARPYVSVASCAAGTCAESLLPCATDVDCEPDSVSTLAIKRQVALDDVLWYLHKATAARALGSGSGITTELEEGEAPAILWAMTAAGHKPAYPPGTYVHGTGPDLPPLPAGWAAANDLRWATDPYAEDGARLVNRSFLRLVRLSATLEAGVIPGSVDGLGFLGIESLYNQSEAHYQLVEGLAASGLVGTSAQSGSVTQGLSMELIVQQIVDGVASRQMVSNTWWENGALLLGGGYDAAWTTSGNLAALAQAERLLGPAGVRVPASVKNRLANYILNDQWVNGSGRYQQSTWYADDITAGLQIGGGGWLGTNALPNDAGTRFLPECSFTNQQLLGTYSKATAYLADNWYQGSRDYWWHFNFFTGAGFSTNPRFDGEANGDPWTHLLVARGLGLVSPRPRLLRTTAGASIDWLRDYGFFYVNNQHASGHYLPRGHATIGNYFSLLEQTAWAAYILSLPAGPKAKATWSGSPVTIYDGCRGSFVLRHDQSSADGRPVDYQWLDKRSPFDFDDYDWSAPSGWVPLLAGEVDHRAWHTTDLAAPGFDTGLPWQNGFLFEAAGSYWAELRIVDDDLPPAVSSATAGPLVVSVVPDPIRPSLLIPSSTWRAECGASYTPPAHSASDNCVVRATGITGTVDTSVPGTYTLAYWAEDASSRTTSNRTVTVVDTTPPTIVVGNRTPSAPDGEAGWYRTPVTQTWTCSDVCRGVAESTVSVTLPEGANQSATGVCRENAPGLMTGENTQGTFNLDWTGPQISAAAGTSPNANGWYPDDVTVSFTCTDAISGVASCPEPVAVGEGAGQSVSGSATDVAGNTASASLSVSVDKTAPVITAGRTPPANAAGWNNTDVTVSFDCSDLLSGIAQCPEPQTFSSEGTDLGLSGTATDRAGHGASIALGGINIDKTRPEVTYLVDHAPNAAGWNNTDVMVTYSCTDALSGVAACSEPESVTSEGAHQLTGEGTDRAENAGSVVAIVNLDKSAPSIGVAADRPANGAGWYSGEVRVGFVCEDLISGIASCPDEQVLGEGAGQFLTGTSVDVAGNSASATLSGIDIDLTDPTIEAVRDVPANGVGWSNADVTVAFTCTDALSGIASCPVAQVFGEGAGQSASGTAADRAGNSASATIDGIDVDKTAPAITGVRDVAANPEGWSNTDVVVSFDCTDALSGVASCPESQRFGEGADQAASGTATDVAGNSRSVTVSGISVDKTAPTIEAATDATTNAAGWSKAQVTVSFTCSDALSGIDSCPASQLLGEGAGQTATGSAIDLAGNSASATVGGINVDLTAPTIEASRDVAANAAGWNNTDVAITFTCSDALSGVASCPSAQVLSVEGAGQSASGTALDRAGHSATVQLEGVSIDKTAPAITASAEPAPNAAGWNNTDVTVSFVCSDELSGIASCPEPQTIVNEGASQEASGDAVDLAGNEAHAALVVNIDKSAPTASLSVPSTTRDERLLVLGNARDVGSSGIAEVVVTVDAAGTITTWQPSLDEDGAVSVEVELPEGESLISLKATDVAGNEALTTATVLRTEEAETDAGLPDPDAGQPVADAGVPERDAGEPSEPDGGGASVAAQEGCGCVATGGGLPASAPLALLLLGLAMRRRRARG